MSDIQHLSAPALAQWLASPDRPAPQVLDVREAWEIAQCKLPFSIDLPMSQLPQGIENLSPQDPLVCVCHHGVRSHQVALYLKSKGFEKLYNMTGGVHAWAEQVDPQFPTY